MPTIIFKPTEACNSNCAYCSVVAHKNPKTITKELFKILIKRVDEYLRNYPDKSINLVWHGGEPLTLGVDFFKNAIDLINQYCNNTKKRLTHTLQSNLTLLNENFIDIFKELSIRGVGTSFEPLPNIRGLGPQRNSDEYNRKFFKSIKLLEKHGINWGFIYVVTKKSLKKAKEIFYFCTNFNTQNAFNIHPVDLCNWNKEYLITPEEFSDFLGEIFPIWYKYRNRFSGVEPFASYLKIYTENKRMEGCETSGNCSGMILYIGPEGNVSHCGRFGDINYITYGNIQEKNLKELLNHSNEKLFKERSSILVKGECAECRFWDICRGGCPVEAYYHYGTIHKKTYWCNYRKIFLERYLEPVIGIKKEFYYADC
jgi:uncharacterized protein